MGELIKACGNKVFQVVTPVDSSFGIFYVIFRRDKVTISDRRKECNRRERRVIELSPKSRPTGFICAIASLRCTTLLSRGAPRYRTLRMPITFLPIDVEILMNEPETLKRILSRDRVIAVVGLSTHAYRPSHSVAAYMQSHGYRIVPVNPAYANDARRARTALLRFARSRRRCPRAGRRGDRYGGRLSSPGPKSPV